VSNVQEGEKINILMKEILTLLLILFYLYVLFFLINKLQHKYKKSGYRHYITRFKVKNEVIPRNRILEKGKKRINEKYKCGSVKRKQHNLAASRNL